MPSLDGSIQDFLDVLGADGSNAASFGDQTLTLSDDGGSIAGSTTTETFLQFDFCITWDGRPRFTWAVAAASPDEAADLVAMIIAAVNAGMQSRGLPGLWGAFGGACPI